jgi:hypothetical protein
MVLCCLDPHPDYMPVDVKERNSDLESQKSGIEKSLRSQQDYPGSRRNVVLSKKNTGTGNVNLIRTGGNALVEYDDESMRDLVRVTIPENVQSGQLLQVCTSDGRTANFMVPFLAKTGSEYLIKFPSVETAVVANQSDSSNSYTKNTSQDNRKSPIIVQGEEIDDNGLHEKSTAHVVVSSFEDHPKTPLEKNESINEELPKAVDSMILVCVPPGVAPGTQMELMLRNNNEKINVTVPPGGVSQFYVARPRVNRCAATNSENKITTNALKG